MSGKKREAIKNAAETLLDSYNKQDMKGISGLAGLGLVLVFLFASKISQCSSSPSVSRGSGLMEVRGNTPVSGQRSLPPSTVALDTLK